MKIRNFTPQDFPAVEEILKEAGSYDQVWDQERHWVDKSQEDSKTILVAEVEKEIVGCVLVIKERWTTFVFRLAVKKQYRNQGVGSALLEAGEKVLKNYGADEVAIFVAATDEDLQEFYSRRGYTKGNKFVCMYKNFRVDI